MAPVERLDILAVQAGDGRGRPIHGHAVGMLAAIEDPSRAAGPHLGAVALGLDLGQRLGPHALELGRREGRWTEDLDGQPRSWRPGVT